MKKKAYKQIIEEVQKPNIQKIRITCESGKTIECETDEITDFLHRNYIEIKKLGSDKMLIYIGVDSISSIEVIPSNE